MSAWILPIGIYKLKLILAAHRMLLREIYGLFYLFWSLRMTHTTKVYFSEAGKDNPFFFFLHMWQVKGHDVYSYGSGLVADCLEKITFLPWTQMDYTYFFIHFGELLSARELHAHKMALCKCQYIWANTKRYVALVQYWHCRRGLVAEALLLVVHCRLSI